MTLKPAASRITVIRLSDVVLLSRFRGQRIAHVKAGRYGKRAF